MLNATISALMSGDIEATRRHYFSERAHAVAQARDIEGLTAMLEWKGIDPNVTNPKSKTLLHVIVERIPEAQGLPAFRRLISLGAELDQADENGMTPLHQSVSRGKSGYMLALLEAGADAKRVGGLQELTTLDYAINGRLGVEIIARLLEAGADPDIHTINESERRYNVNPGGSPLMSAIDAIKISVGGNYAETAEKIALMLIEAGTEINTQYIYRSGESALHLAIAARSLPVVRKLLEYGADTSVKTLNHISPLRQLCQGRGGINPDIDPVIAEALIRAGANPHECDEQGRGLIRQLFAGESPVSGTRDLG